MVEVERIMGRTIVALKISRRSSINGRRRLESELSIKSLWYGPDQCLLVSDTLLADAIINDCSGTLVNHLHNAVEYSSGLAVFRLTGANARELLAADCGVDFRPSKFTVGSCCRTRFAQIPAVISAEGPDHFDVYVDRSYENFLSDWMCDELTKRPNPHRTVQGHR